MVKTVVKIEGMACGMCESHMNDTFRNKFQVKKFPAHLKIKNP